MKTIQLYEEFSKNNIISFYHLTNESNIGNILKVGYNLNSEVKNGIVFGKALYGFLYLKYALYNSNAQLNYGSHILKFETKLNNIINFDKRIARMLSKKIDIKNIISKSLKKNLDISKIKLLFKESHLSKIELNNISNQLIDMFYLENDIDTIERFEKFNLTLDDMNYLLNHTHLVSSIISEYLVNYIIDINKIDGIINGEIDDYRDMGICPPVIVLYKLNGIKTIGVLNNFDDFFDEYGNVYKKMPDQIWTMDYNF